MHILIGKRQILISALVITLSLAVFVNWYFTGTKTELNPEGTEAAEEENGEAGAIEFVNAEESDYFAAVRLERSKARDETVEELESVMAGTDENSESAVQASAIISALSTAKQRESDMESLITSAIGGECVAVISENTVDVVVSRESLNDDSVLKISDIVSSVCGGEYENVRISAAMG